MILKYLKNKWLNNGQILIFTLSQSKFEDIFYLLNIPTSFSIKFIINIKIFYFLRNTFLHIFMNSIFRLAL